jgi:hypothetical protein
MASKKKQAVPSFSDDTEYMREFLETARLGFNVNTSAPVLDEEGLALAEPAPNAIEWVVGEKWCNVPSTYQIYGQYEVLRDFFQLRCPICNDGDGKVWGKTRMQLESEILLVWHKSNMEDTCPKCRSTRSELTEDGLLKGYNQMHLVIGQRAGKSVCAGLMGTYIEHFLLTLGLTAKGGLHGYFGLDIPDPFEMTFLAATDVQSADTIWSKYFGIREESPWFQRYVPWVKKQEALQIVPAGMKPWGYKATDKRVVNWHPSARLICNSLNSNAPGLRGRTRVAAFADELSHMEQTDSKKSATEVYRALERSQRTLRTQTKTYGGPPWIGLMASVTSPVSRNDKGMELLRTAERVPTLYVKHLATWEFTPRETYEVLKREEYEKDPVGFMRDYGARPPGAAYPLIHDEARFRKLAVDFEARPRAQFENFYHRAPTGQSYVAVKMKDVDFIRDGIPRYTVWDAGVNWDAFAGCCAHGEWLPVADGNDRLVTVIDWIVRILPEPETEVFFDSVRDVMRRGRDNMPIIRCEFDRWQSYQLIQQIREFGIFSEQKSTTDADYVQFKVDCFSGLVRLLPPLENEYKHDTDLFDWTVEPPKMSAAACAIYEILGAQCDPDSHKVSFPEKGEKRGYGSNDVCQVMVHAHTLVQKQGYTDRHDDRSLRAARIRAEEGSKSWGKRGYIANMPTGIGGGVRNWNSNRRGW